MIGLKSGNYLGRIEKLLNVGGVIASITSYPDTSYSDNLHYHDTLHASLVLTGGNIEKRHKRDIERLPGVVTFYDAGELHQSTKTLPSSTHINIEIENSFLKYYEMDINAASISSSNNLDAKFLMLKICNELKTNDDHSKATIHSLVLNLLQKKWQQRQLRAMPSWITVVHELMQDKWSENISLSELSNHAKVHPVTVSRIFSKYFGCTIGEYMRKLKIEKALYLIRKTPNSLTEISAACGFSDQSHFIRVFKQQTGFIPNQYKQLNKR